MNNKNDCCSNKVELDLNVLIDMSASAISNARQIMDEHKRDIENHLFQGAIAKDDETRFHNLCNAHSETEYFLRSAAEYAQAVNEYYYLVQARDRETVEIIRGGYTDKA